MLWNIVKIINLWHRNMKWAKWHRQTCLMQDCPKPSICKKNTVSAKHSETEGNKIRSACTSVSVTGTNSILRPQLYLVIYLWPLNWFMCCCQDKYLLGPQFRMSESEKNPDGIGLKIKMLVYNMMGYNFFFFPNLLLLFSSVRLLWCWETTKSPKVEAQCLHGHRGGPQAWHIPNATSQGDEAVEGAAGKAWSRFTRKEKRMGWWGQASQKEGTWHLYVNGH